ncbi:cytochrome oxidase [Shewanella sp. NFH-SH190041]|uniref:cbb3-type cytochrome oxidase subunit 3 n=1 Tax=Shewanella sp. NFH-SH190041 TaxID=2950245 RepID=UPI0021C2CBD9|nr:cbb3-type cytochrome c oxidase subunit 3 [Shewanella sp. NFH-SH190041]BDM64125.1 cytochrome oxidase [Shewanella sp. NFH-SH190041]
MDYGTFQGVMTLLVMVSFVGIFAWAYSARRHKQFDEAAHLIFTEEEKQALKRAGEQTS